MQPAAFDHAAEQYEATRGFPPDIAGLVAGAVTDIVGPGARVLEMGIGTGRIARPLFARGLRITGIDLSQKMMRHLIEALPPDVRRPALVQADAVQLPLASGQFDAVVAVHLFHLVAHWRRALAEAKRCLNPTGVLLIGYDWRPPDSPGARILKQWQEIVGAHAAPGERPGALDIQDVTAALIDMGAAVQERAVGEWTTTRTLARHIETIEHRTWAAAWNVPDDFFPKCLAELRAWTTREFGPLEHELTVAHKFVWQKFYFPITNSQ